MSCPDAEPDGERRVAYDAVLLIAFGGPQKMDDVRPFLENVTRGRGVPAARLREVARHYEVVDGRSRLTEVTVRQAEALRRVLAREGPRLPVYVGMRNWHPFLKQTLARMAADRVGNAVGIILSAQQSAAGWQRYHADVDAARRALGARAPEVGFGPGWHAEAGFIGAVAARTRAALAGVPADRRARAHVVFTAHSLPCGEPSTPEYARQVAAGARLVAVRVGLSAWSVAYQSRSGPPHAAWLEPDIGQALAGLAGAGVRDVVVVPVGFVSDNVEVVYDLDTEAQHIARQHGLNMIRAKTVDAHPLFIGMLAELVRRTVQGQA